MGNIPPLRLRFGIKCSCCTGSIINETNDNDIDEIDAGGKECMELMPELNCPV
jgi:hypothetical protein